MHGELRFTDWRFVLQINLPLRYYGKSAGLAYESPVGHQKAHSMSVLFLSQRRLNNWYCFRAMHGELRFTDWRFVLQINLPLRYYGKSAGLAYESPVGHQMTIILLYYKKNAMQSIAFRWYGWQDLNLHAIALEPKSSVSANFTTSAKHHYYSTKIDYVKSLLPRGKHFLFFYLKIVAFCRLIWYSNCCLREWLSGRVSPCQGESRGSESRLPLHA